MTIQRILRKKVGTSNPNTYVGNDGEIFLDDTIPDLRLSDGVTPGGLSLSANTSGVATYVSNAGYSTSSGISTLAQGLTGTPNIFVGVLTATTLYGNGINLTGVVTSLTGYATTGYVNNSIVGFITSGSLTGYATQGYVDTKIGLSTSGLLSSTGSGSLLTGIVTSITAGSGVSISQSSGNVTITATAVGGGENLNQTLAIGNTSTLGMSVGVVTATSAIIGSGVTIQQTGIRASGIITANSFRPISGYYQSGNGTNAFYIFDGTGNVSFQGNINVNQIYSGAGYKALEFSGNTTPVVMVTNGLNVTGVTTSSGGFVGNLTGTATSSGYATSSGIATYATTSGVSTVSGYSTSSGISSYAISLQNSRTFEITGDIIASQISFNGTGNVSLAATIQPNSVALGSDTTGDYVQSISGTSNQITVTSGTGESSTPTLSIPTQFTAPQDVTVTRDLQVNRNLNVTGNITIGGTSAFIAVTELKVSDPDLVLGFRTDVFGNDISNDNTANHGGIAIASTEGSPLISLYDVGIGETNPATYKKIMWFKSGTFSGLGTDAWLSNYAVGIGSTQFPTGTRLAAGNVQFTQNDLAVVRNINSSGVITATTFSGTLSGNASSATYATTSGIATYASSSGVSTYATTSGIATYATTAGVSTYSNSSGISTYSSIAGIATYATSSGIATYSTTAGIATYASVAGIATYATSSGISTYADTAGVSTTTNTIDITNTNGLTTIYYPTFVEDRTTGQYLRADVDLTYRTDTNTLTVGGGFVGNLTGTATTATNVVGGIGSLTSLNVSGVSTLGITSTTDLTSQTLNVSGISTLGNVSIGAGSTTLIVNGTARVSGGSTFAGNLTVGSVLTVTNGMNVAGSNGAFTYLGTSSNFSVTNQTTGSLNLGGASQTGTQTFGQSTVTHTVNYASGASGVGTTKTINFGTGGLSGSFTNINIGATAGVGTVVINSGTNLGISSAIPTSALDVSGDAKISGIITATEFDISGSSNTLSAGGLNVGIATVSDLRLLSSAEKLTRIDGNTVSIVYGNGSSGNIGLCTNPTGDITINITGIPTDSSFDNQVITFSVFVTQTGTARSCTAVNLNGVSRTINWSGGSLAAAISGVTTTSGIDIYNFTGINTIGSGSTTANYRVLGIVNGGFR